MAQCRSCGSEIQSRTRFCPECGAAQVDPDDVTALSLDEPPQRRTPSGQKIGSAQAGSARGGSGRTQSKSRLSSASSSSLLDAGRFLPGSLLADRYRIVALLGRGGMGEVYRADDLTLGQPVALKFLPEEAASDPGLLERFRNEVRISRKVSHPNVCRVYDVGEVEGQTFFTMEYVDGEDLASLLRRIGRLPNDKATDIARQLCAGLAAAHAKGVLHRDLKPANIMLDGRGQAVITDFGLAALTNQTEGAEIRSGTPAYMAPEQLAGKEVTERSDIYSLGLVLYEIFTGKRAFSADDLSELLRSRSAGTVSRPSSIVKDMDPLVERAILHCLEADPARRPASALAVAAALPGGDPLAAALAAGETPSPQMVAAAGEIEGMNPRIALACLGACIALVLISFAMISRNNAYSFMSLDLPPDVLNQKAKDIVAQLGYNPRAVDSLHGFDGDLDLQTWIEQNDKPRPDWNKVLAEDPPLLYFAYRQSPRDMVAKGLQREMTPGVVTLDDPPLTVSGMIVLLLDPNGKLTYFQMQPPQKDESTPPAKPMDWSPLLAAAGLDPSQLQKATPQWLPLGNSDERAAWTGKWPQSGRPLRVEAASWHGKPIYFQMIGPWTRPNRLRQREDSFAQKLGQRLGASFFFAMLAVIAWLARRQYKQGKGDRVGATRVAIFIFLAQMAIWLCFAHFSSFETQATEVAIATSLYIAGICWLGYLSLEPYVRKLWPQTIISWTRLISGRLRDPLVGRDVMFGVILGVVWVIILEIGLLVGMTRFGASPQLLSADYLNSARSAVGAWVIRLPGAIQGTLFFFIVLVGLRYLLRNRWLAAAAFVVLFTTMQSLGSTYPQISIPTLALVYAIAAFSLVRFGLITLAVAVFVANMMLNVPITLDFSRWYATTALIVPISVLAIAIWGFYNSLGGRKLIKEEPV